MAKRWRDETAAGKGSGLLKRRKPTEHVSDDDTVDPAEESTKRRRIAGERRTIAANTETASDIATETAAEPEPETDSTTSSEESPSKDASDDSETLARDLAAKPRIRTRLAAPAWATLTGLIVGSLLTGLVYAGMQAFQAIYNTPAGDGVGAVVLVVVLAVSMLVGRSLLKWRGLHDPNATALLGILLMVIVTLGVLLPIVFTAWMPLITPLLGGASYLISHLLVTHFGEQS